MHFVLPVVSVNSMQRSGKLEGRQPSVLTCSITAPARFWASGWGGKRRGMRWVVIKFVVFLCRKSRVLLRQWSGNERIGFEEGTRGSKKVQRPVMTTDTGKNVDVGEGRWNWWFLKWVWSENWHRRRPGGAGSWILCARTCWGVGVCVQTPGSAASCCKSYFEVGIDNLISSAALFHLWGKKEHILQEKL